MSRGPGFPAHPPTRVRHLAHVYTHPLFHMATKKPAAKKPTRSGGAARQRSLKVANDLALGLRKLPPENLQELPENATPLDVMLMAMRRAFMIGGSIHAAPFAEKAAPYVHAKISSIELKNPLGGTGGGGKPMPFLVEFVDPPKE